MRLLLARHGESICGVEGIVGGARGCTGLTERGLAQAAALRDRLVADGLSIDVVLSSTFPRAAQTADVVAEALRLPVERLEALCERIPGEADGMTWDVWRERYEQHHSQLAALSPGGEDVAAFFERVASILDDLRERFEGQTVLACTHGGVIFGSVRTLLSSDPTASWLQADFTSITEWTHNGSRWTLVRLNDVSHLAGTDLIKPTKRPNWPQVPA
ncbi:MAG: histidine phosphatase family protein [Actinomycetota bacterium]